MSGEIQGCRSYSEGKGTCILAQLCQQPFLQPAQRLLILLRWRKDLDCVGEQIFPEGQAEDVEVFPAITEGAVQSHEHWAAEKIDGKDTNRKRTVGKL